MKCSVTKKLLAALAAGFIAVPTAHAVSCGQTITGSEVMDTDLFCLLNDPVITIDGGKLNMNGHTIGCAPGQDGVAFINTGGKLMNGSIEGCDRGVVLAGSGKHTVMDVSAKNSGQSGFHILGSGNKLIRNTSSGSGEYGFRAATAFPPLKDKFIDNLASNNALHGFYVIGDQTTLTGNVAFGNGDGIRVEGDANKVSRNTAYNNDTFGIFINGEANSAAANTTILNGATGLAVIGTSSKSKGNVSVQNTVYGMDLNGSFGSHSSNKSYLNTNAGFAFFGTGSELKKSTATLNSGRGIWLVTGSDMTLKGNRASLNGSVGFDVNGTTGTISGNLGYDNTTTDADDNTVNCGTNVWSSNMFGNADDACIE